MTFVRYTYGILFLHLVVSLYNSAMHLGSQAYRNRLEMICLVIRLTYYMFVFLCCT